MLIFGGESGGILQNDLWKFHFGVYLFCVVFSNPKCQYFEKMNFSSFLLGGGAKIHDF